MVILIILSIFTNFTIKLTLKMSSAIEQVQPAANIILSAANHGGLSELVFSPITMLGLGQQSNQCIVRDANTGLESEMGIFTGWQTTNVQCQRLKIHELLKLMKNASPVLNTCNLPEIDGVIPTKTAKEIFDNIQYSVATCASPSRFMNKCYISGQTFTDEKMKDDIITHLYTGGPELYGVHCYSVTIQCHKSLEFLFPIADLYFNVVNKLIPLVQAFPKLKQIANGEDYLLCKFQRSNGQIQQGFIKLNRFSMLRFKQNEPYITVYFKSSGENINPSKKIHEMYADELPEYDSNKAIKLADFLAHNPVFGMIFENVKFETLMLQMMNKICSNEQI